MHLYNFWERKKERRERERDVTYTTVMQQLSKLSFFRQKIFKSKYDQLAPGVVSSHLIELGEFIWIEHKGLALQILYIKAIFSCIKKESQQICFLPKTKALALNCKTAELLRNTVWNSLHNLLFIMPNMVHLCMVCTDFFLFFLWTWSQKYPSLMLSKCYPPSMELMMVYCIVNFHLKVH